MRKSKQSAVRDTEYPLKQNVEQDRQEQQQTNRYGRVKMWNDIIGVFEGSISPRLAQYKAACATAENKEYGTQSEDGGNCVSTQNLEYRICEWSQSDLLKRRARGPLQFASHVAKKQSTKRKTQNGTPRGAAPLSYFVGS